VRAATAEALLAMKVLSASGERPRDLGDIAAIVRANHAFDEQAVLRLVEMTADRQHEDLRRTLRLEVDIEWSPIASPDGDTVDAGDD